MEERFKFILDLQRQEWSLAELCRRYQVSRKTGYKWWKRYERDGLAGLRDQSRAPLRQAKVVSCEVAEAVVEARRKHPHWGPRKLAEWLPRQAPEKDWPAASTMGEILQRAGLSVPRKKRQKATPSQSPLSHAGGPNQVWCADFKGWFRCGDGSRCDALTVSDAYSRYLLRCQALPAMDERSARGLLEAAFREYGLPEAMRTDNGEPFASVGLGGLSRLSVWWIKLGIRVERIAPGKPQQNGRHERMHRTLKQATAQPAAANLRMQQKTFDQFRREYNEDRPHEALEMKTPADYYHSSSRCYPSRLLEPEYGDEMEIRRVGPCGTMTWRGAKVFVSKVLAHEPIGLEPMADGLWRVWYSRYAVGLFDERKNAVGNLKEQLGKPPSSECEAPTESG
jgi:putative transposase